MRKVRLKTYAGFSLLELMVVVAIIGVLATFAIPRFNIFRARARQGEAKSNLGVIFTLQEAFKIDKEEYYNGNNSYWGGEPMNNGDSTSDGYTGYKNGGNDVCKANRLGFRLANCGAARYRYWVAVADEDDFLVAAYAPSDSDARIFPGCQGNGNGHTNPRTSVSPVDERCKRASPTGAGANGYASVIAPADGGDGFCLDQGRRVDNFRDIVSATDCDS